MAFPEILPGTDSRYFSPYFPPQVCVVHFDIIDVVPDIHSQKRAASEELRPGPSRACCSPIPVAATENGELLMSLSISYSSAVSSPPPLKGLEHRPSVLQGGRLLTMCYAALLLVLLLLLFGFLVCKPVVLLKNNTE